ncbi:hypothetical protein EMCRGX_G003187 [Ephydatia muelleri]
MSDTISNTLYKMCEILSKLQYGTSSLMRACKNGHAEVVRILVSAGAHINDQNKALRSIFQHFVEANIYTAIMSIESFAIIEEEINNTTVGEIGNESLICKEQANRENTTDRKRKISIDLREAHEFSYDRSGNGSKPARKNCGKDSDIIVLFSAMVWGDVLLEQLAMSVRIAEPLALDLRTNWGKFVNTHGGKGCNLPCDLHNEHVNRLYKQLVANVGANFTESASTRAARAVSSLERLALGFERQTGIHPKTTAQSRKSDVKDVQIVVEVVLKARILEVIDKRCQSKFLNFFPNPLDRIDRDKMMKWIEKKAKQQSNIQSYTTDSDNEDEEDSERDINVVDEPNEMDY